MIEINIKFVCYKNRSDTIETAVRRAVITGVNQTCGMLQEARAEEMECDLIEVTAHAGARPSHAEWQGKIYSRSGTHPKYPSLVEATGYGSATGLKGVNCRHDFYPFIEGVSEPAYEEEELTNFEEARDYTYNGQEMTEYEATQQQRYIERQIRKYKRKQQVLKAAGLPDKEATSKVTHWNKVMDDFLRQTGLKEQIDRELIGRTNTVKAKEGSILVENSDKKNIIKSIDIDDFETVMYGKDIAKEVSDIIYNTIREAEKKGEFYISETAVKSIPKQGQGTPALQIEPMPHGTLRLNINSDFFAGRTIDEINEKFRESNMSVVNNLEEAIKHECGHAKLIKGLQYEEIEKLYNELGKIHIDGISMIALDDGVECIAEIEVLLFRGESVPKEAMELYEKYIRR